MGSIQSNKDLWNNTYDWQQNGDEWSAGWGGAEMQWHGSILPRIHQYVPVKRILEIAPGFGRWTQFLQNLGDDLVVVDVTQRCIEFCKERFKDSQNITYHLNDGKSLEMIEDDSIDFVFSFDSLVHVEEDVMEAYLKQIPLKLKKDGVTFIHHSNAGEYSSHYFFKRMLNRLPLVKQFSKLSDHDGWRAQSVTAKKVRDLAQKSQIACISQEMINWHPHRLTDCISVFTKEGSKWWRKNQIFENRSYIQEQRLISDLSKLYSGSSFNDSKGPS